jgi:arginine repressor
MNDVKKEGIENTKSKIGRVLKELRESKIMR